MGQAPLLSREPKKGTEWQGEGATNQHILKHRVPVLNNKDGVQDSDISAWSLRCTWVPLCCFCLPRPRCLTLSLPGDLQASADRSPSTASPPLSAQTCSLQPRGGQPRPAEPPGLSLLQHPCWQHLELCPGAGAGSLLDKFSNRAKPQREQ